MKNLINVFFFLSTFQVIAQFERIEDAKRLGGSVNTSAEENFPIFLKSDGALYFIRTFDEDSKYGPNDQNIWVSEKEGELTYSRGESVKKINNKFNNCIVGFSSDESKIYLLNAYGGKKDLKKGICYSVKKGNNWSKPKEIKIPELDIEGQFYGFHINKEENVIIISYSGPNTKGEEDLYYSELVDGKWTIPKSMGEAINSSGFEISPFLSENSDTLFFASNGFGGEGGADIFYSTRVGKSWEDWSKPVNLGSKINSPKFDAYFTMSDRFLYWSSNREAQRSDIYYTTFLPPPPPLFASAEGTDVTIYQGTDGKIDLTPKGGVAPYSYQWSNGSKDEDPQNVPKGTYEVVVTDAVGQKVTVSVPINEPGPVIVQEIKPEITLPQGVIYFDLNSSYLNKQNYKDLDAFIVKMKDYPNTKLTIISHCDRRESDTYNIWLSKRRMERTIGYLIEKGISRKNISGDFRGEREPDIKCDNCTEDQFTKNRRTTIQVAPN
ncbi:MAG: OmpA family protein [Bacteroidetes bacterium]|nr:OmpA family protein [Bacteroidota bacterium]